MEALLTLIRCHFYFRATLISLLIIPLLAVSTSRADGSKDLINNGGYRPFLEAGNGKIIAGIDRLNRFFIYARAGETLQLGSSALGIYEGDILFTRPDGTSGSCLAIKPGNAPANWGTIRSVEEEKAGPQPNAGGYTACEVVADASNEGIWEVVFLGPAPGSWKFSNPIPAGAPWVQATDVYTIAAWDLTVRDEGGAIVDGRVYTQHLPLNMGGPDESLASEIFVLTKDGYRYHVDLNGMTGHTMMLFANASGFEHRDTETPLYKSVAHNAAGLENDGLPADIKLHSPLLPDTDNTATHKLFFTSPSDDLPVAVMHGTEPVWLANPVVEPVPFEQLTYSGSVGKTGSFSFQSTTAGRYLLVIDLNENGIWGDETDTFLAGIARVGENIVPWNGLDGDGFVVSGSETGYQARVVALAGELHLPALDLENRTQGFTIERLNGPGSPDYTVYYNDRAFNERDGQPEPVNGAGGVDSRAGAHGFTSNFGNEVGIDTWTYVASSPAYLDAPLFALENDLRLSISVDKQTPAANQTFVSTIRVANDGPDDAAGIRVALHVPADFVVQGNSSDTGVFSQFDNTWRIEVLANGAEAVLDVTMRAPAKGAYAVVAEIVEHRGQDPDSQPNNFDERIPDEQAEDDTDQVNVYVAAESSLGIAAHVPSLSGDLTGFTAQFELLVENLGNTPLSSLQVTDNLTERFQGTDFQVVNAEAVLPLVINPSFDGDSDINLLDTTQSRLEVGEQATISFTVQVTPFGNLGPYTGNASGFATGLDGARVEDLSDAGLITDFNQDGAADGSGEDDPTVLSFDFNPAIGLAMQVSNVSGTADSFTADYKLVVENLGNVPLESVQVINDLGGLFGSGNTTVSSLSASAPLVVNTNFDGQNVDNMLSAVSTLGVGDKATIFFKLQATPSLNLGFFNHLARAIADVPYGLSVSDMSDDGDEPDGNGNGSANDPGENDVTVITFGEEPAIGASLIATQVSGDLGGFTAYYELTVKNLSDVSLSGVQVLEDLGRVFAGTNFTVSDLSSTQPFTINPAFDGASDKNLLARFGNTLAARASAKITYTVQVDPVSSFGPFRNSVVVYADSPEGITITDTSDSGSSIDPDNDGNANETGENDPTITAFAPTGHLGTALSIASITGDLNNFNVVYKVIAENLGDVPLSELSLVQDLQASLAGTRYTVIRVDADAPFEANPLFDGQEYKDLLAPSTAQLGVGEQISMEIELSVVPVEDFGPYEIFNTVAASTPFNTQLTDVSTDGLNPDPNNNGNPTEESENTPSVLSLNERPVIGLSMAATSVEGDMKGFTAQYVVRLENLGDVPLENVGVTSDFSSVFEGAEVEVLQKTVRGSVVLNKDFDGGEVVDLLEAGESMLAPGDTARITMDIHVVPVSNFGPYAHTVIAAGLGPNGTSTSDISDAGFEPDVNENGIANEENENRPTLISIASRPAIGVAKILANLNEQANGFEATFNVTVKNTGDVLLTDVQVVEDLDAAFSASSTEVRSIEVAGEYADLGNTDYDGLIDTNLFREGALSLSPGEDVQVSYVVNVVPAGGVAIYETQALASATGPGSTEVTDLSDDGIDPDPNGNGNASDAGENTPTQVDPSFKPSFALNTTIEEVSGDTTRFEVLLSVKLANTGEVALDSLNFSLDLDQMFSGSSVTVLDLKTVSGNPIPVDPAYDGRTTVNMLLPQGTSLNPDESGHLKLRVEVVPGTGFGPFRGVVDAVATTLKQDVVYASAHLSPIRVATSTGEEAGLESNGDLATLVSARNYKQQHTIWQAEAAKYQASPLLRTAGAAGVDGTGSLRQQDVLELVPTEGPEASAGIITTPVDLFGVTNATSILAVDYVAQDERVAALFATTSPFDELYDHTKNICDRLKGASLESVELISIKGHPFVLSVLVHDNGEVDYAISFIGYRSGFNYLVDSRFVRDAYLQRVGVTGEILNFQVWSYNPAYTIAVVEEVLTRMEDEGGLNYVSREDDIPEIPEVFVERGSYQAGQMVLHLRKPEGVTEFVFQGEVSSVEGGDKSVFERVIPVPGTSDDEDEVVVVLPSGQLFDALLTVTNDANDNVDQIYIADGPWGKIEDQQEGTNIETFQVLEQADYEQNDSQFVVERGVAVDGSIADSLVLFRHFRPGGRSIDLSEYSYVAFTASGIGSVQLRLEEVNEQGDFFMKDIELKDTPTRQTIFLEDFAKRNGQQGFRGLSTSAISFVLESAGAGPAEVALRVEDIVFGKGLPTHLDDGSLLPTVYSLSQNYPNPFNPSTTIQFGLPEPASVALEVFDMLGRRVMVAAKEDYIAGRYKVVLDASRLASGAYIYRLVANEEVFTKIMHVVK